MHRVSLILMFTYELKQPFHFINDHSIVYLLPFYMIETTTLKYVIMHVQYDCDIISLLTPPLGTEIGS